MNVYEQDNHEANKKRNTNFNLRKFDFVVGFLLLLVCGCLVGVYTLAVQSNTSVNVGDTIQEEERQNNLTLELQSRLNATEARYSLLVSEQQLNLAELQQRLNKTERLLYGPRFCPSSITQHNKSNTGDIYTIYPGWQYGKTGVQVYCDFITNGGVWLVFQRRKNGSENFNRGWEDYVNGFGKLDGEFWMGLEKLQKMTAIGRFDLRIDMEDFDGDKRYALYNDFYIGRGPGYQIFYSGYSGTAGNGLEPTGTRFSTHDRDQDSHASNCAKVYTGGWWFADCHFGNPNGVYYGGPHTSYGDGVCWQPFRGYKYSLKSIDLKVRIK